MSNLHIIPNLAYSDSSWKIFLLSFRDKFLRNFKCSFGLKHKRSWYFVGLEYWISVKANVWHSRSFDTINKHVWKCLHRTRIGEPDAFNGNFSTLDIREK